jgi:hypothetical protein
MQLLALMRARRASLGHPLIRVAAGSMACGFAGDQSIKLGADIRHAT